MPAIVKPAKSYRVLSINFEEFNDTYQNGIVPDIKPLDSNVQPIQGLNPDAHVLVAIVPLKDAGNVLKQATKAYWTRPKFPSTIDLKQIEYFVPYISGKGIRDIYQVTKIHTGTKKDLIPECNDNRMRLVFEVKFLKQLFDDFKPHDLQIWHTFTDITIKDLLQVKPIIRFVDLFAGIGGIRLGLEQAAIDLGYETQCVLTSEIKPTAIKVLRQNHPKEDIFGDITELEADRIPDFDILCAGFPCQAFSFAGKRLGFEGKLKTQIPNNYIIMN